MYTLYWWVYQRLSLHQLCRASLHMNWQLGTEWGGQVFWLTHPFVTGRAVGLRVGIQSLASVTIDGSHCIGVELITPQARTVLTRLVTVTSSHWPGTSDCQSAQTKNGRATDSCFCFTHWGSSVSRTDGCVGMTGCLHMYLPPVQTLVVPQRQAGRLQSTDWH